MFRSHIHDRFCDGNGCDDKILLEFVVFHYVHDVNEWARALSDSNY